MKEYSNIDEYVSQCPDEINERLTKIRNLIAKLAPEATESISYGIPTFKLNGNLIHFAGYANHIGLYPGAAAIVEFKDKLKYYKTAKGSIQFPLSGPIPYDLIEEIVKYRISQRP